MKTGMGVKWGLIYIDADIIIEKGKEYKAWVELFNSSVVIN